MFAFIKSAFSWILLGLAIAFFMSKSNDKKHLKKHICAKASFLGLVLGLSYLF